MAGITGIHKSIETYVTATPPPAIVDVLHPDPGYIKPARSLQFGPQGNSGAGQPHNWPDTFQRP
jgi:hypothetical protein